MQEQSEQPLKIDLPTRLDSLGLLEEHLAAAAEVNGFSGRLAGILRLILEELVTNSIVHGRAPPSALIKIAIEQNADSTNICYSDAGFPFDPRSDLPRESRFDDLEDRPVGRLGWSLILFFSSLEDYTFADGRNRMVLKLDLTRIAEPEDA